MNGVLKLETEKLARSWMQHDAEFLRDYLVASVEDPRINVQSILTRHFLIANLCGAQFQDLMLHELRFAAVLNWLLKHPIAVDERQALLYGLQHGADNVEGDAIPYFVSQAFATLPARVGDVQIPNYLEEMLLDETVVATPQSLKSIDLFLAIWRQALVGRSSPPLAVLEPGCGSANDYRFLDQCGLSRLIDYTGFDLCDKNIANALSLFPNTKFAVGNVFEIAAPDKSIDLCFVHDLLEHFSLVGLERAVAELCRVTRGGLCVHFFQMEEMAEHVIRAVDDYHFNTLSLERTEALFVQHGFNVQPLHIGTYLRQRVGYQETHNPNAYTFLAIPQ